MDTTHLLSIASSLVATLFGLLTVLIGWVGSRLIIKQDTMLEKLDGVKQCLNERINDIDVRLVRLETMVINDRSKD